MVILIYWYCFSRKIQRNRSRLFKMFTSGEIVNKENPVTYLSPTHLLKIIWRRDDKNGHEKFQGSTGYLSRGIPICFSRTDHSRDFFDPHTVKIFLRWDLRDLRKIVPYTVPYHTFGRVHFSLPYQYREPSEPHNVALNSVYHRLGCPLFYPRVVRLYKINNLFFVS